MAFKRSGTHLAIPHHIQQEIIAHCRSKLPKEACGLLAGDRLVEVPNPPREVTHVYLYPMTNVEDSPIGYAMDPKEQLLVEKQMRQRDQRLLGIYHSHTASDAIPSSVDVSLAISPDISYVLVSLKSPAHPVLKTYRIVDGEILEEDLLREDRRV